MPAGGHRRGRPGAFDGQGRVRLRRLGVQQDRADRQQPAASRPSPSRRRCGPGPSGRAIELGRGAAAQHVHHLHRGSARRPACRAARRADRRATPAAAATSPDRRSTTNSAPCRASARSMAVWNSRSASARWPTAASHMSYFALHVEQVPARVAEAEHLHALREHLDLVRRAEHDADVLIADRRQRVRAIRARDTAHQLERRPPRARRVRRSDDVEDRSPRD